MVSKQQRRTYQISLRIVALGTEDEAPDEAVEQLLQLLTVVGAVHNVAVVFGVELGLRSQLTPEVLARV